MLLSTEASRSLVGRLAPGGLNIGCLVLIAGGLLASLAGRHQNPEPESLPGLQVRAGRAEHRVPGPDRRERPVGGAYTAGVVRGLCIHPAVNRGLTLAGMQVCAWWAEHRVSGPDRGRLASLAGMHHDSIRCALNLPHTANRKPSTRFEALISSIKPEPESLPGMQVCAWRAEHRVPGPDRGGAPRQPHPLSPPEPKVPPPSLLSANIFPHPGMGCDLAFCRARIRVLS